MNKFKSILCAGAMAACATPGVAAELDFFGFDGRSGVNISVSGGPSFTGRGGAFRMGDNRNGGNQLGLGDAFIAFCLDLAGTVLDDQDYVVNNVNPFQPGRELTSTQIDNVKALFNSSYASVDTSNNIQAAAFQLALWDAAYENNASGLGLGVGDVLGNGTGRRGARVTDQANIYLGNISTWDGSVSYQVNFLDADVEARQDLVMATPIPLPAGGLLLLTGLGGAALLKRRKKKAST